MEDFSVFLFLIFRQICFLWRRWIQLSFYWVDIFLITPIRYINKGKYWLVLWWYWHGRCITHENQEKSCSTVSYYLLIIYNSHVSMRIYALDWIYHGVTWRVSCMRNILSRMIYIWSNLSTSKVLYV